MTHTKPAPWCPRVQDSGKCHQLQLWIHGVDGGLFNYEIRQAYVPGGRLTKSAVLDSGKAPFADQQAALAAGNAAFDTCMRNGDDDAAAAAAAAAVDDCGPNRFLMLA